MKHYLCPYSSAIPYTSAAADADENHERRGYNIATVSQFTSSTKM